MNSNKAARVTCVAFSAVFSAVFFTLFMLTVFRGYENVSQKYTYSCSRVEHIIIILLFAVFTAAGILLFSLRRKPTSLRKSFFARNIEQITAGIIIAVFLIQLFCVTQLRVIPENDLAHINHYAVNFAKTGSFAELTSMYKSHYVIKYPNNLGVILILSGIYRAQYLVTGQTSDLIPVLLNVAAINLSIIFTVKLADRLYGKKAALASAVLCAAFSPFYTYSVYYYTDTLSMPFIIGSLYLFFISQETESAKMRYILTAIVGVLVFTGFIIKGNAAILLPCLIIYAVLKFSLKRAAAVALCLILSFAVLFSGFKFLIKPALIPNEMSERYQYPYSHWVMMGLNGYGDFHRKDSKLTARQKTIGEKKQANIKKIKARLRKKGFSGLIKHLIKKAVWTWSDGTYYASHHIDSYVNKSFLHEFVLIGGKHYFLYFAFSCAYQLFLIVMMILSGIKAVKTKSVDFALILRTAIFGMLVFLLIWETRPRYLLNFTPIFILLTTDGLLYFRSVKGCRKTRQPEIF